MTSWGKYWAIVFLLVFASLAPAARLADWAMAPAQSFTFRLQCGSNEVHLIQRSTNLVDWTTLQRSASGGSNRLIQVPSSPSTMPRSFFRGLRTNEPLFAGAIVAAETISNNGYILRVDSFDSSSPLFSTNGLYTVTKARDRGRVTSNGTGTNLVTFGNSRIYGVVSTGLGGTVSLGPNGCIGDLAWQANPGTAGLIKPGWVRDDADLTFPDIRAPFSTGGLMPALNVIHNGVLYQLAFQTDGDYVINGSLSGKVLIDAHVRIRVNGIALSGTDCIQLTTNSTAVVYMNGTNATFGGQGIINPNPAAHFMYFGAAENESMTLAGNGPVVGAFYAPQANVILAGGGTGSGEFSGSLVVNAFTVTGNWNIHFDEALLENGPKN